MLFLPSEKLFALESHNFSFILPSSGSFLTFTCVPSELDATSFYQQIALNAKQLFDTTFTAKDAAVVLFEHLYTYYSIYIFRFSAFSIAIIFYFSFTRFGI